MHVYQRPEIAHFVRDQKVLMLLQKVCNIVTPDIQQQVETLVVLCCKLPDSCDRISLFLACFKASIIIPLLSS